MTKQMNNFKRVRLASGKTVEQVAEHLNVTPATIYYFENGERYPNVKRLRELASFYNVSFDELMKEE